MSKELVKKDENATQELSVIEQVVMQGDLSKLNPEQRVMYYRKVCDSLGLNPFTRPFDYILLNGKLTLYAKKDATEQLRKVNGISITKLESKIIDDLYIVTAQATTKDGRTDQATGAVTLGTLKGDARANALMKAETKAKRRVTLSIAGMGWVDETEVDSIPSAKKMNVDLSTGEILNEDVKPLYIEEKKTEEKISTQQAIHLAAILSECDPQYASKILKYFNIQLIDDLPLEHFDMVEEKAIMSRDKYKLLLTAQETKKQEVA